MATMGNFLGQQILGALKPRRVSARLLFGMVASPFLPTACLSGSQPTLADGMIVRYICEEDANTSNGTFEIREDPVGQWKASWRKNIDESIHFESSFRLSSLPVQSEPAMTEAEAFSQRGFALSNFGDTLVFLRFDMSRIGSTLKNLAAEIRAGAHTLRRPLESNRALSLTWIEFERLIGSPADVTVVLYSDDGAVHNAVWEQASPDGVEGTLKSLTQSTVDRAREREKMCEYREFFAIVL